MSVYQRFVIMSPSGVTTTAIVCVCVCVCETSIIGFPVGSDCKESACNVGDLGLIPGLGRAPGERNCYPPTPVFLPGEFQGQRSLGGYSPWDRKESNMTELLTLHFKTLS